MAKNRIAVLGGAFDPIHEGHFRMARAALDSGLVDKVLVVPCGVHPGKQTLTPALYRWQMVVAACSRDPRLEPSRLELDRPGPSYTADTLTKLRLAEPKAELYLIVGADTLVEMLHWVRLETVLSLATLLVCPRAAQVGPVAVNEARKALVQQGARVITLNMEPLTVSSSKVRDEIRETGASAMIPACLREYCALRGLYGLAPRLGDVGTWLDQLFLELNPHRFAHTLGVALTAQRLAQRHGVDPVQAEQAGLLHDCAKCMPLKTMQQIARVHSLTDDPEQLASGALLHSVAGAWVARNSYGMADPEVLEAICYHNTGKPGMTRLDMVVYLADAIEPGRSSYPVLDKVRLMSQLSLERALRMEMEATVDYVLSSGKHLHSLTTSTLSWLKTLPEAKNAK